MKIFTGNGHYLINLEGDDLWGRIPELSEEVNNLLSHIQRRTCSARVTQIKVIQNLKNSFPAAPLPPAHNKDYSFHEAEKIKEFQGLYPNINLIFQINTEIIQEVTLFNRGYFESFEIPLNFNLNLNSDFVAKLEDAGHGLLSPEDYVNILVDYEYKIVGD